MQTSRCWEPEEQERRLRHWMKQGLRATAQAICASNLPAAVQGPVQAQL